MAESLHILAIEPFFGGFRRESLRALAAHSRHIWHLYTLPARRAERRLAVSGTWFGELLHLRPPLNAARTHRARLSVAVVGDLLNVPELRRLCPPVAKLPLVLRYHAPAPEDGRSRAVRLSSLRTADEIWVYGPVGRSVAVAEAQQINAVNFGSGTLGRPGGQAGDTTADKVRLVPPPVEHDAGSDAAAPRSRARIAVDATRPLPQSCRRGLMRLHERGEKFTVCALGHAEEWPADMRVEAVDAGDVRAVGRALRSCRAFLGSTPEYGFDPLAVRALWAGCWVLLPRTPLAKAMLVPFHHSSCLHEDEPQRVYSWLLTVLHQGLAEGGEPEQAALLAGFEPESAAAHADAMLDRLARNAAAGRR